MDYAQVVKTILKEHEAFGREDATGEVTTHFVYDDTNAENLLINVGWRHQPRHYRVHTLVFHGWVQDGKVWIELDNLSPSVSSELIERGVPKADILAAYEQPCKRRTPPGRVPEEI